MFTKQDLQAIREIVKESERRIIEQTGDFVHDIITPQLEKRHQALGISD
ncbi:MAG: hypothetical protein US86_C0004G0012 [Candidatus Daviesbacteria bacterium GW2011_GWA2_38_24]|uniref:Acyl-CoA dehydrogenase n=1 Tax=Candidatus Daviesbacteria bacterium GW2011_GWA2_38_24 TaxID=1618422 RepID=A0A0G0LZA4_9BACT|nr:MAG: hypothetical protein US86_C0004G0012 [Candidatus Daviesbacteria bacterium GW2011_GWA2_38_24]